MVSKVTWPCTTNLLTWHRHLSALRKEHDQDTKEENNTIDMSSHSRQAVYIV